MSGTKQVTGVLSYNFDVLKEGTLTFMVMSEKDFELELIYTFLAELRESFISKYSYQRIETVRALELDNEFAPSMRLLMINYNSGQTSNKTKLILKDLEDLKDVVTSNLCEWGVGE